MLPIIGITADHHEKRHRVAIAYSNAVKIAGGIPIILPPISGLESYFIKICQGFIFTGGDDPIMEEWDIPTHPNTTKVNIARQEFELGLLKGLKCQPDIPVLGVCLGMQWMCLLAGGSIEQDLAEPYAGNHTDSNHQVTGSLGDGVVHSHHHQAILNAGSLEVIATANDGVIEAVQDTTRRWYIGVQWHPERTENSHLGQDLFTQLVQECSKLQATHS